MLVGGGDGSRSRIDGAHKYPVGLEGEGWKVMAITLEKMLKFKAWMVYKAQIT